jgi:cyclophilin family peptidyl-prolyl cis-trans isomerase
MFEERPAQCTGQTVDGECRPRHQRLAVFHHARHTPWLDGKHTVYGTVQGDADQAVVDSIAKGDTITSITTHGDTNELLGKMADQIAKWNRVLDAA